MAAIVGSLARPEVGLHLALGNRTESELWLTKRVELRSFAPLMSLVIGILTFILVLTSLFLVMIVLMQRAKTDGGIGAAMAGGATESAFGAETNNVLSGATIKAAIVFFVLSFGLFLANIHQAKSRAAEEGTLPTVNAPAVAPATSAPALEVPLTTQPAAPQSGAAKP